MDWDEYYPGEPITFYTKAAGVSKENRQDLIRKYCRSGMDLYPICEPENEFDKYAVALYVKTDDGSEPVKIGYIPAKYSHALYKNVELGLVIVEIDATTGGDNGKYLGVNLCVTITPDDENEIQNLEFFLENNDDEDKYSSD